MSLDIYLETPTKCPHCGKRIGEGMEVWSANVTHNLGAMADEAGIGDMVWSPEKVGIKMACQLIEPLRAAIETMKSDPERFRKLDAKNKWGTYDNFVPWLERLLGACREWPNAEVKVSR